MLSTCEICRRRDYCDNCAMAEDCYWLKAIPPEGGGEYPVNRLSVSTMASAVKPRLWIGG